MEKIGKVREMLKFPPTKGPKCECGNTSYVTKDKIAVCTQCYLIWRVEEE